MRAMLKQGYVAEIKEEGALLTVSAPNGEEVFTAGAPEHSSFYQFSEHVAHGTCPIVSFDPGHQINGWQDWFYKVNVQTKAIERLNPWR